jgi:hypothetical protein
MSRTLTDAATGKVDKQQEKEVEVVETKKSNNKISNAKLTGTVSGPVSTASDSADSSDIKTDKQRNSDKDVASKSSNRKSAKTGNIASSAGTGSKKKVVETTTASGNKKDKEAVDKKVGHNDDSEKQHLSPNDVVEVGDNFVFDVCEY